MGSCLSAEEVPVKDCCGRAVGKKKNNPLVQQHLTSELSASQRRCIKAQTAEIAAFLEAGNDNSGVMTPHEQDRISPVASPQSNTAPLQSENPVTRRTSSASKKTGDGASCNPIGADDGKAGSGAVSSRDRRASGGGARLSFDFVFAESELQLSGAGEPAGEQAATLLHLPPPPAGAGRPSVSMPSTDGAARMRASESKETTLPRVSSMGTSRNATNASAFSFVAFADLQQRLHSGPASRSSCPMPAALSAFNPSASTGQGFSPGFAPASPAVHASCLATPSYKDNCPVSLSGGNDCPISPQPSDPAQPAMVEGMDGSASRVTYRRIGTAHRDTSTLTAALLMHIPSAESDQDADDRCAAWVDEIELPFGGLSPDEANFLTLIPCDDA